MPRLNSQEGHLLLTIARGAVRARLANIPSEATAVPSGLLQAPPGVFVSIHSGQQLRGCIGRIEPVEALSRTTEECAVSAALEDPRFSPLELAELDDVWFEISVLSPPQRVSAVDQIEVGRHGLLVQMGAQKGLLLPQVASDHDWDSEEFLRQACLKAGVPPSIDSPVLAVSVFEAQVFAENS